ncbi:MAG: trans-4-hydroxy-L-proline dehydratase [Hyphomicrobiales bacterium]
MNYRINKLRQQSLDTENTLSVERGLLLTEFYKNNNNKAYSIPVQRAKAFEYILTHKEICILDNELIVGERGPKPKACPTYPEICLHSIKDLEIISNREKVSFKVDQETIDTYNNFIIPFWTNISNRDKIMSNMDESWIKAYKAGVFTEFQEQRAPGHTVLGKKMFNIGFKDLIAEIESAIDSLDFYNDLGAFNKREELKAMLISCQAIIKYANRHADKLSELAEAEKDDTRKDELLEIAQVCRKVPENAPETIHEALQHYWFIHLGVITELNPWDSFNPGRLDQHLMPFYENDLRAGKSKEQIIEFIQAFWIKFNNHPAPPKMGVTAKESNTYTDFSLINLGGLTEDGKDATNEMTYILLDVIEEMRLLQPSSMIQVSKKNPDRLILRALEIIKTGFGQPSIFNTDAIIAELLRQGKSLEDARNGGASGCIETGAFGKEAYILSGYFNLPKVLELTVNNGFDPYTKAQIGLQTGTLDSFKTFDSLMEAFKKQLSYFIDIKVKGNNIIDSLFSSNLPVPFLSVLIDDCIKNGKDYNSGGARYNSTYIQGVGLGSITDSLTAIKYHVFDNKNISLSEYQKILENNFNGFEEFRYQLVNETPKYGNDDDYADTNAVNVFNLFYELVNERPNTKGGKHRINMLPTTCHIYFGSVIGASHDGRKASEPLSEGISPFQGTDTNGPSAVIKSAAKIDHIKTGGTLLNQKFSPEFLDNKKGIHDVCNLVRAYFRMDGHHIQFNVIDANTLRDAQQNPQKYNHLIVRVAGYSDYFNDLGVELQNEIIRRTEHKGF